jgi:hypothetical protein
LLRLLLPLLLPLLLLLLLVVPAHFLPRLQQLKYDDMSLLLSPAPNSHVRVTSPFVPVPSDA